MGDESASLDKPLMTETPSTYHTFLQPYSELCDSFRGVAFQLVEA